MNTPASTNKKAGEIKKDVEVKEDESSDMEEDHDGIDVGHGSNPQPSPKQAQAEGKFFCGLCHNKSFPKGSKLYRHEMVIHIGATYPNKRRRLGNREDSNSSRGQECEFCHQPERFASKNLLLCHLRHIHFREEIAQYMELEAENPTAESSPGTSKVPLGVGRGREAFEGTSNSEDSISKLLSQSDSDSE